MTDKLPPHDLDAERYVIGCLLYEQTEGMEVCVTTGVNEDWFYDVRNREVFEGISRMEGASKAKLPNHYFLVELAKSIEGYDLSELGAIMDHVFPTLLEHHLQILKKYFVLRKMCQSSQEISRMAGADGADVDALLGMFENRASEISDAIVDQAKNSRVVSPEEASRRCLDDLERRVELFQSGRLSGIPTGFPDLDKMTGGLQKGEMTIIGGRPAQGKSSLACGIAHHVGIKLRIPTAFVTLEMADKDMSRKMVSMHTNVLAGSLRSGSLSEQEIVRTGVALKEFASSQLCYVDSITGTHLDAILSTLRNLVRRRGIKLVVVDYLQKITPTKSKEKHSEEVGEISQALKAFAHGTGTAMLALAQLKRLQEGKEDRMPKISDLSDSSQIEKDGDLIALIWRPKTDDDPEGRGAKLVIGKQRDGETGVVDLYFNAPYARFESVSRI